MEYTYHTTTKLDSVTYSILKPLTLVKNNNMHGNLITICTGTCDTDKLQLDCGTDKCLDYLHICNGIVDCQHGTDEKNCGK